MKNFCTLKDTINRVTSQNPEREKIFVYGVIWLYKGRTSFFCIWISSFLSTVFWREWSWPPFQELFDDLYKGYFCTHYSKPQPHCFDYYSTIVKNFEIRKCKSSSIFFSITLAIWGPSRFHTNFRMDFSNFCKSSDWDFDKDCNQSVEKAMAPHSSTLAWKIPWEEPGRLQSMGLQRVRHDWATSLSLFTFMHRRRKWQPTPVFLPGESQGQGSLVGCHLWDRTESDTTEVT